MEDLDAVAAHESRELNEVVERLLAQFPGTSEERVRALVTEIHERFDGDPIRGFVPVFVERAARDELAQTHQVAPENG